MTEAAVDEALASAKEPGEAATDPDVSKLNETYALVIIGDKVAILKTAEVKFLAVPAFKEWLANRFIQRNDKRVPLAKYWMQHPQRRQYEGVTFAPGRAMPGQFNLWRGFAVEPRKGDCSKFLAHVRDNICGGDEGLYRWVTGWFAQMFQQPEKKIGTSLCLRGKQGTGKTKVGEVFGSLLGVHYVGPISDPRYITGRFNSHLVQGLLLHADEAFWAGDHEAGGKLRDLVTGETQQIEFKGKEPIRVRNYLRLLVCGNSEWLVPAGLDERRFAVLDVGEAKMKDNAYFAAIDDEMDNGGREALLAHLLAFDLKTANLRVIPNTTALLEQKFSSLTPEQAWWLDTLMRGVLPWGCDGVGRCPAFRLFNWYIQHASRRVTKRRAIETQIGMFLTKHVPGLSKGKGSYKKYRTTVDATGTIYGFPSLDVCRQAFAKALQSTIDWSGAADDDWSSLEFGDDDGLPF